MHQRLHQYFQDFGNSLIDYGLDPYYAGILSIFINVFLLTAGLILLDRILRRLLIEFFKAFTNKTKSTFDDYLILTNFPRYVGHIIPINILKYVLAIMLHGNHPMVLLWVNKAINVYVIILILKILRSVLRTSRSFFETKEKYHDKPLQSYVQVTMLFLWSLSAFFIILEIFDKEAGKLALQLGTTSAVLLLIFKDTIMGFVASIQVSVNDIVRIGDWITFSKFGADGTVTEINLATVRVQNFDNTYTTIPTYSLIADSFQNWRGMQDSDGRRIKRAIFIKQRSVRFLTTEDIEELKKIQLIAPYIEHREQDLERTNRLRNADRSLLINGRNQTNLGIFRRYIDAFLHENPAINKDLFLMVRHLAPTSQGIPIEIFCFSKDKRWEIYEHIQADIFDHIIAAVPYFKLEIFEEVSSSDLDDRSFKMN
ncbi:mechanosensitive ion channel family protein [Flavimarina sp. Hel_I_48]|uniref:mechanosensitive ion channel family protein n=1 Tax=Flavimarina sp. Hel_I_48 TaxID=1392488 RepID=UPI0004DF02DC|nr:mechanosensitive ion channel domain-containing protein [Flavimarina sp. Hel_I_48]